MSQNEATNDYIFPKSKAAFYAVIIKIVLEFIEQEIISKNFKTIFLLSTQNSHGHSFFRFL